MNFLIGLAAKLIEKLVVWIAGVLSRSIKENKEIKEEQDRVEKNLKKIEESKTPEEKRKHRENLLNDSE